MFRRVTFMMRDYDYLSPLACGDLTAEGLDLVLMRDTSNALDRTLADSSIDGGELSLGRHIQRLADGDHSFVGIPFFPAGGFRQRTFFVRRGSSLRSLSELAKKRIGTNEWPATGTIWSRAVLREAGVNLEEVQWWIGSVDGARGKVTQEQDVLPSCARQAPADRTLTEMLLAGELDALMCPRPPGGSMMRIVGSSGWCQITRRRRRTTSGAPASARSHTSSGCGVRCSIMILGL